MQITGNTQIYGIIGDPVAHSLSPLMQNAAFVAHDIPALYVPFHVCRSDLPVAINGARALGVKGLNVTIPHKEQVCPLLDDIDDSAKLIGAVNTIVNKSGKLMGYNTDGLGLLRSLKVDLNMALSARTDVVVLGAGGAARAAIVTLAQQGVRSITVVNRSKNKAQKLVERYGEVFSQVAFKALSFAGGLGDGQADVAEIADNDVELTEYFKKCHLIVNSTSIGLSGESFNVIPWETVNKRVVIYDMVYSAQSTPLVRAATEAGLVACDGLGMLSAQGEAAFELWTGHCVDGYMRSILEQHIQR